MRTYVSTGKKLFITQPANPTPSPHQYLFQKIAKGNPEETFFDINISPPLLNFKNQQNHISQ